MEASAHKSLDSLFSGLATKLKTVGATAGGKIESMVGGLGSKLKGVAETAATRVENLLSGMSPKLGAAAANAAQKLGSLVGEMGSKLKSAAGVIGTKVESLGPALRTAMGSITGFFGGITAVTAGLAAVIAGAVAYIGVKLDEMFNNGRILRKIQEWARKVGDVFGANLPTGEVPKEAQEKAQKDAEHNLRVTETRNSLKKDVRDAQRATFVGLGKAEAFDRDDLAKARGDVADANKRWDNPDNHNDSTMLGAMQAERIAAYEHVKEAQEHILDATRETTRELQSQLDTQRQQVAQAAKLVEQEKARFEGRKADFAQLPADVQAKLAAIGNKLGKHKPLNDDEAELSKKYGFFRAAVTAHYAGKVNKDYVAALKAGGESGVEAAENAVQEAKAKEAELQKSIKESLQHEKDLYLQIYDTVTKIVQIKGATLPTHLQPKTALPNLGGDQPSSGDASGRQSSRDSNPKPTNEHTAGGSQSTDGSGRSEYPTDSQSTAGKASQKFAEAFDSAVQQHLVPAIDGSIRRAAACINNSH